MNSVDASRPTPQTSIVGRYRWTICALLFAATTINYIDRQILSLLKPILDEQLGWTNAQFGLVNSLFQGAYAISYLMFGMLIDRKGTKIGYAISIAAWSIAAAAHALVNSVPGFGLARIALGLGEGGNFPAAIKSVAAWFPQKERPFATTLFNSGANVGALVAPALVPPLALAFGWHMPFIAAGAAGFIWIILWWWIYEEPSRSRGLSAAELAYIEDGRPKKTSSEAPISWGQLLKLRQTWAYLVARILTDPVWWFFLIWLPDYFKQTRGMDLKKMGAPLIAIYAIVTVVSIAGGWASKRLADKGWSIQRTRRTAMVVFAALVAPVVMATSLPLWFAVALIGLAGGAHQAWSATLFSTVSDIFPSRAIASVTGLGGMVGSLGGMVFPIVCGMILDSLGSHGYTVLFIWAGGSYLVACLLHVLLCPRIEPVTQLG